MKHIWPRLERQSMLWLWRRISARSRDRTTEMSTGTCLILAPHPDDETLGCGGLILHKRAAGARVDVVVVTDGAATHGADGASTLTPTATVVLRERETVAACDVLGVSRDRLDFLKFPDGDLAAHEDRLRERLAELVADLAPAEIYVCALSDGHRDHRALARVVRALHGAGQLGGAQLWEYPIWFWDFRSWRPAGASNKGGFVAGVRAALTAAGQVDAVHVSLAGLRDRKKAALNCHRSQVGLLEEEPGWIGLQQQFLDFFLRDREVFFRVLPDAGADP
ncbi:PIG-L deacetylase family protein [Jannaschia rubra]|uniref:PIG-L deacetylase family protein n=1 Tax=Jannaschia rubra TaxID=282197 RepID=UPI00248F4AEC|nr:PIG-L deacetylase family protein [Jannaschia rubra]